MKRLEVSGGFAVVLAAAFWLDEGTGLLPPTLLACALHELGHVLALKLFGGRVKKLRLTAVGAELVLGDPPLSYGREAAVALAGPGASLGCAWLAAWGGAYLLAGTSLALGLFNLLPILPLDGGRVLHSLLSLRYGGRGVESGMAVLSAVAAGCLLGAGLAVLRWYGNFTLLLAAGWLLAGILRRTGKK